MFSLERHTNSRTNSSELVPILSNRSRDDIDMYRIGPTTGNPLTTTGIPSMTTWPWVYWLILKVLCVFHTRKIVCSRRCHQCRLTSIHGQRMHSLDSSPLPSYLFPSNIDTPAGWLFDDEDSRDTGALHDVNSNEIPEDERDEECQVCRSMWLTADGKYRVYTEKDIGASYWNHRYSFLLSIVLLLSYVSFVLYDGFAYLLEYWGYERQLLRLISYLSYYISVIATVPLLCLVAKMRNIFPRSRIHHFAWTTSLHPRYIVKRLQYLRPETHGFVNKPFLAVCVLWPLLNSVYRAAIYICMVSSYDMHIRITLLTNGVASLLWGCFCYLMIILRASIQTQLKLDIAFLLKHVGKIDVCRRRLAASMDEYGSLCSLTAKWMIINVSMVSLGLATHVSWNYLLFSDKIEMNKKLNHMNIMIWSEIIMMSSLPLIAVGGLDLHHIWDDFRTRICEVRCDEFHQFWEKMFKFITKEMDPVTHVVELTFLFSVLTLYMALQVNDQSVDYWYNYNKTALSTIGPSI